MKRMLHQYRGKPGSLGIMLFIYIAAALTVGAMLFLVGHILIRGIVHLHPSLFSLQYTAENVSMLPAIWNTVYMTVRSEERRVGKECDR